MSINSLFSFLGPVVKPIWYDLVDARRRPTTLSMIGWVAFGFLLFLSCSLTLATTSQSIIMIAIVLGLAILVALVNLTYKAISYMRNNIPYLREVRENEREDNEVELIYLDGRFVPERKPRLFDRIKAAFMAFWKKVWGFPLLIVICYAGALKLSYGTLWACLTFPLGFVLILVGVNYLTRKRTKG